MLFYMENFYFCYNSLKLDKLGNDSQNYKLIKYNNVEMIKCTIFNIDDKNLSKSDKQILSCINQDPTLFLSINIVEYANIVFTSKSCITRLAQKIGFKSLYQMKLFVQQEVVKYNLYSDIKDDATIDTRIKYLKSYNNYAINETLVYLDLEVFYDVCKKLTKARRIAIAGVGSSFLAANELANNLQRIGVNATCNADLHNTLLKISNFDEQDILITFCKSGLTKEIRFLNEITKIMKGKTLMITANSSKLENLDYKILLKELEKEKRIIATSSKISQLVISDAIFFEVNKIINNDNINSIGLKFLEKWKKYQ